MDQNQREFLRQRIDQVKKDKIDEVRKLYVTPAIELSGFDKYELLKKGKGFRPKQEVERRITRSQYNYETQKWAKYFSTGSMEELFDFSAFERQEKVSNPGKLKILEDRIIAASLRATDAAMLGSNSEALQILNEFANAKFV